MNALKSVARTQRVNGLVSQYNTMRTDLMDKYASAKQNNYDPEAEHGLAYR